MLQLRVLSAQCRDAGKDCAFALCFGEGLESLDDRIPIHLSPATLRDPDQVGTILMAVSERLEHEEVLGRANPECDVDIEVHKNGAAVHFALEWQSCQRDIDRDTVLTASRQQQHSVAKRELARSSNTGGIDRKECVDDRGFSAETGEERNIEIARHAWLPPVLERDTADKTETETPAIQLLLKDPSLLE